MDFEWELATPGLGFAGFCEFGSQVECRRILEVGVWSCSSRRPRNGWVRPRRPGWEFQEGSLVSLGDFLIQHRIKWTRDCTSIWKVVNSTGLVGLGDLLGGPPTWSLIVV